MTLKSSTSYKENLLNFEILQFTILVRHVMYHGLTVSLPFTTIIVKSHRFPMSEYPDCYYHLRSRTFERIGLSLTISFYRVNSLTFFRNLSDIVLRHFMYVHIRSFHQLEQGHGTEEKINKIFLLYKHEYRVVQGKKITKRMCKESPEG